MNWKIEKRYTFYDLLKIEIYFKEGFLIKGYLKRKWKEN